MKYFFIAATILLLGSCSSTKTVNCPPKFNIYRNINKAYPVYTRDLNIAIKNSLSTTKQISDTASINFQQNIVKLRDNFNNISSRAENLIKSNLLFYFSGICDENIRKNFADFQNKLADMTLQLSQIEAKIGNSKGLSNDNEKNINEAVNATNLILKNIDSGSLNLK